MTLRSIQDCTRAPVLNSKSASSQIGRSVNFSSCFYGRHTYTQHNIQTNRHAVIIYHHLRDDSKINSLVRESIRSWIRNGLSGTEWSLGWSVGINRINRKQKTKYSILLIVALNLSRICWLNFFIHIFSLILWLHLHWSLTHLITCLGHIWTLLFLDSIFPICLQLDSICESF